MLNTLFHTAANGRGSNNVVTNPASLAYLRWLAAEDADQQEHYVQLRKWHDGEHEIPLTTRQKEYLAVDDQFEFAVNYLRLPVELVTERLTVTGFDGPAGIGGKDGILWEWWENNRMDGLQSEVHRATAKDGDTYVLVEWDDELDRPIFTHEPAFDGVEGVKVHYLSNLKRTMTFASKRWSEQTIDEGGHLETVHRLNLYLPDRIEKYYQANGWKPYTDEIDTVFPIPWEAGVIPVVHFRWKDDGRNWGESELEQLVPLQWMINKAALDEAEAADKSGMQAVVVLGAKLPADQEIHAGDVLSITGSAGAPLPTITTIPPGDLHQLRQRINDYIFRIAQLSHIPLQYFQVTGNIASAETQAADDSQLVAKVKSESVAIGNAWETVMEVAMKLSQVYGGGRALKPTEQLICEWQDFERVDAIAFTLRRAEVVQTLVNAGLSLPGVLALPELAFSEDEQIALLQRDVIMDFEEDDNADETEQETPGQVGQATQDNRGAA